MASTSVPARFLQSTSAFEKDCTPPRALLSARLPTSASFCPSFGARIPSLCQLSSPLLPAKASLVKAQAIEQEAPVADEFAFSDRSPPPPGEGTKLYVGNLPWNVNSASLAEIFQDAGVVEEVEVICDRDTGRSRGFAFVVMSSPGDAEKAIEKFHGSDLGGRILRVNYPEPQGQRRSTPQYQQSSPRGPRGGSRERESNPNKLYVGNLSWGVDDAALTGLFEEFGKVLEARVVIDRDSGRSKGFGFVTLADGHAVESALSNLNGAEFDGRQLRVNLASQKPDA